MNEDQDEVSEGPLVNSLIVIEIVANSEKVFVGRKSIQEDNSQSNQVNNQNSPQQ